MSRKMLSVNMYLTAPLSLSEQSLLCCTRGETVSAVFSHCISHPGLLFTLQYLSQCRIFLRLEAFLFSVFFKIIIYKL